MLLVRTDHQCWRARIVPAKIAIIVVDEAYAVLPLVSSTWRGRACPFDAGFVFDALGGHVINIGRHEANDLIDPGKPGPV